MASWCLGEAGETDGVAPQGPCQGVPFVFLGRRFMAFTAFSKGSMTLTRFRGSHCHGFIYRQSGQPLDAEKGICGFACLTCIPSFSGISPSMFLCGNHPLPFSFHVTSVRLTLPPALGGESCDLVWPIRGKQPWPHDQAEPMSICPRASAGTTDRCSPPVGCMVGGR